MKISESFCKYVGKVFPIEECPFALEGNSITTHLDGCKSILVCSATLGESFDRLLRRVQLESMSEALLLDREASKLIEKFCNEKDSQILRGFNHVTARYSPGYGDFPLSANRSIIQALGASTKIGLCVTDDYILTPQKSITGIVGLR